MFWVIVFFVSAILCGLLTMIAPHCDQRRMHAMMWVFFVGAAVVFLFGVK